VYDKLPDKSHLLQFLKIAGLIAAGVWALDQIAEALSGCYQIDIKGGMKTTRLCNSDGKDVCDCAHARDGTLARACGGKPVGPCWDNEADEKAQILSTQHYDYIYQKKSIGDVLADTATFVKDAAAMVPATASSLVTYLKWGAVAVAVVVGIVVLARLWSEFNRLTTAKKEFSGFRHSRRRKYTGLETSGPDQRTKVSSPWLGGGQSPQHRRSEGGW
jgi:hypothetical protein